MSEQLTPEAESLVEIKPEEVADSLKKSEVLVVDDSRLMRMVLTKALKDLGFTNIDTAVDGRDAINKKQSFWKISYKFTELFYGICSARACFASLAKN